MNEVLRYRVVQMTTEDASDIISYFPYGPEIVMARAYDALQVELTKVQEELASTRRSLKAMYTKELHWLVERHALTGTWDHPHTVTHDKWTEPVKHYDAEGNLLPHPDTIHPTGEQALTMAEQLDCSPDEWAGFKAWVTGGKGEPNDK